MIRKAIVALILIDAIALFFGALHCAGSVCDGWRDFWPWAIFLGTTALIGLAMWRGSPRDSGNSNPTETG